MDVGEGREDGEEKKAMSGSWSWSESAVFLCHVFIKNFKDGCGCG